MWIGGFFPRKGKTWAFALIIAVRAILVQVLSRPGCRADSSLDGVDRSPGGAVLRRAVEASVVVSPDPPAVWRSAASLGRTVTADSTEECVPAVDRELPVEFPAAEVSILAAAVAPAEGDADEIGTENCVDVDHSRL